MITEVASPLHPAIIVAMGNFARSLAGSAPQRVSLYVVLQCLWFTGEVPSSFFPVGPVMPRRVLFGEPGTDTAWEFIGEIDSLGWVNSRKDRRFRTRTTTCCREPPSRHNRL